MVLFKVLAVPVYFRLKARRKDRSSFEPDVGVQVSSHQ